MQINGWDFNSSDSALTNDNKRAGTPNVKNHKKVYLINNWLVYPTTSLDSFENYAIWPILILLAKKARKSWDSICNKDLWTTDSVFVHVAHIS